MKQGRFSKQRELIYETLVDSNNHPSAEMIYQSLKPHLPSLSLGTVYRNLNHLVQEGRAVRIPSVTDRYDGVTHEHPHFLCLCCHELYDLDIPIHEPLNPTVENLGHKVHRHELIFKGICLHCLSKKTPCNPDSVE